jgi:MinD-like ATPase involved in chromosome partitioning or flagellar assembly/uncharacterized protein involved in exopolysaccharide biosynthesis
MNSSGQKNWLLTIILLRLPVFFWGTIAVCLTTALVTLAFRPIYSATTLLSLDFEMSRIVGSLNTAIPAVNQQDFIRYEFFASHNISLMKMPQLARAVIENNKLCDSSGRSILPEYLVQPGIMTLLFNTNGQGIRVDWISDTQTFAITGLSRNPEQAELLSREYAKAFLDESSRLHRASLQKFSDSLRVNYEDLTAKISMTEQKIREIKDEYKSGDPTNEIIEIMKRIQSAYTSLANEMADEAAYQTELSYYNDQLDYFSKQKRIETYFVLNPNLDTIGKEVRTLMADRAAGAVDFTSEHPDHKQIEKRLEVTNKALAAEPLKRFSQTQETVHPMVDNVLSSITALDVPHMVHNYQVDLYKGIITSGEQRIAELNRAISELHDAELKRDALGATLLNVAKDHLKVEYLAQNSLPLYRVISEANINNKNLGEYRYFPKRKKTVIIALFLFALLLFILVIGKELNSENLYYSWQFNCTGKEIGCVDIPEKAEFVTVNQNLKLLTHLQDVCLSERKTQLIRLAGRSVGEGKSTIAQALAQYLRQNGATLLIDGDTVGRSLSRKLDLGGHPGLLDILAEHRTAEVVVECNQGLYVLPIGTEGREPIEANFSARFSEIITRLASEYNHIVYIDTPFGEDCTLLADSLPAHDVILVLLSGAHSINETEQITSMRRFNNEDTALTWLVVNKSPTIPSLFSFREVAQMLAKPLLSFFHRFRLASK